jgi:hypothetical protein
MTKETATLATDSGTANSTAVSSGDHGLSVGFLGSGMMASAIMSGLVSKGVVSVPA